jgi:predicted DsbA family dithiol-disulfide isomerase
MSAYQCGDGLHSKAAPGVCVDTATRARTGTEAHLEVWGDLTCIWSYLGWHRLRAALENARAAHDLTVVYRSYPTHPDAARLPIPARQHVMTTSGLSPAELDARGDWLAQVARADGVDLRLGNQLHGNTGDAHRVLMFARDAGRAREAWATFFRAYWVDARTVFDPAAIIEIAAEAGLDRDAVATVLATGRYADAVASDRALGVRHGVSVVPHYLLDRRVALSGDQTREALDRLLGSTTRTDAEVHTGRRDGLAHPVHRT